MCVCVGWSQPGILQIGKTIGTFQEHHEGRHRQQQHGQHLPSQESCGAAEDGGLHGQDKGVQSSRGPDGVL